VRSRRDERSEQGRESCTKKKANAKRIAAAPTPWAAAEDYRNTSEARQPHGDLGNQGNRFDGCLRNAAQRIGVQRPATALTGPDPATRVCRQTAAKVN